MGIDFNPNRLMNDLDQGKYLYISKGELRIAGSKKELKQLEKQGVDTKIDQVAQFVKESNFSTEVKVSIVRKIRERFVTALKRPPSSLWQRIVLIFFRSQIEKSNTQQLKKLERIEKKIREEPFQKMIQEGEALTRWAKGQSTSFFVQYSNSLNKYTKEKNYTAVCKIY
jgi:hypothetical protein